MAGVDQNFPSAFSSGRCIGVLLAAGFGRRYAASAQGADKLLARLPDGRRVAQAAAAVLREALPAVVAVVRPGSDELTALLRGAGCTIVSSVAAQRGMGASLAAAAAFLAARGQRVGQTPAQGCVVALADMPWLDPRTVAGVAQALTRHAIVAPVYRGRRGHPVGFTASLWPELAALDGDTGARMLLQRHGVHAMDCQDPGVLRDIDTLDDLPSS